MAVCNTIHHLEPLTPILHSISHRIAFCISVLLRFFHGSLIPFNSALSTVAPRSDHNLSQGAYITCTVLVSSFNMHFAFPTTWFHHCPGLEGVTTAFSWFVTSVCILLMLKPITRRPVVVLGYHDMVRAFDIWCYLSLILCTGAVCKISCLCHSLGRVGLPRDGVCPTVGPKKVEERGR
jgi:hypothetical protein